VRPAGPVLRVLEESTRSRIGAARPVVGLVVFAAVIALSQQHQRAFSPAMFYLLAGAAAAGLGQALGVD
jgi:hypothetical protein